jgi:hypothetical protein
MTIEYFIYRNMPGVFVELCRKHVQGAYAFLLSAWPLAIKTELQKDPVEDKKPIFFTGKSDDAFVNIKALLQKDLKKESSVTGIKKKVKDCREATSKALTFLDELGELDLIFDDKTVEEELLLFYYLKDNDLRGWSLEKSLLTLKVDDENDDQQEQRELIRLSLYQKGKKGVNDWDDIESRNLFTPSFCSRTFRDIKDLSAWHLWVADVVSHRLKDFPLLTEVVMANLQECQEKIERKSHEVNNDVLNLNAQFQKKSEKQKSEEIEKLDNLLTEIDKKISTLSPPSNPHPYNGP